MIKHVPNALTLLRLVLAPVIAWYMVEATFRLLVRALVHESRVPDSWSSLYSDVANSWTLAATLFVVAALTDLFDGLIARAFNAHSKLGRIIDPIADKALVGLPLIVISWVWDKTDPLQFVVMIASAVIIIRDVTMTVVRFTASDGEGARVSSLAKIKTALELVVVGSYLVASAIGAHMRVQASLEDPDAVFVAPYAEMLTYTWLALLVITAALSAYTGWQYLRPKR